MSSMQEILAAMESAERHEHPERLMRITLECSHIKLQTYQDSYANNIGWYCNCKICCELLNKELVSRQIVNYEETGVL